MWIEHWTDSRDHKTFFRNKNESRIKWSVPIHLYSFCLDLFRQICIFSLPYFDSLEVTWAKKKKKTEPKWLWCAPSEIIYVTIGWLLDTRYWTLIIYGSYRSFSLLNIYFDGDDRSSLETSQWQRLFAIDLIHVKLMKWNNWANAFNIIQPCTSNFCTCSFYWNFT